MIEADGIQYKNLTLRGLKGLDVLSCAGDKDFSKHVHNGYVLWLNSRGGEKYQIQNTKSILQPGQLGIVEPGIVHENKPYASEARHLRSFYFSCDFVRNLSEKLEIRSPSDSLKTSVINNRNLWFSFIKLHNLLLMNLDDMAQEESLLSSFKKILQKDQDCHSLDPFVQDDQRINSLIEYLHDHIAFPVTLHELESQMNCTSFHIIRLFRQYTGLTPHSYLMQLRLEKSRELIKGGVSLIDAAVLSGFSDQSHMSRLFKNRYGMSPGKYKKQMNI